MTHEQTQLHFPEFQSGSLSRPIRSDVQRHLDGCRSCRALYTLFAAAVTQNGGHSALRLGIDPYLPTRIRALAATAPKPTISAANALRWSFLSAAFGLAVTLGILLGEGISHPRQTVSDDTIVSEFASSLSQYTITDQWSTAAQSSSPARSMERSNR